MVVDATAADLKHFGLLLDGKVVLRVDHRFTLSNPALVSALLKIVLQRQLDQRLLTLDRGQGHHRLESHCVVPGERLLIRSLLRSDLKAAGEQNFQLTPVRICGTDSL
jgi:hypothetical protein